MRGTECKSLSRRGLARFIPACAGNSRQLQVEVPAEAVHPRVCGEQGHSVFVPWSAFGSSPRVRGTARRPRQSGTAIRFIPACAGNRLAKDCGQVRKSVHPRVCGEQTILFSLFVRKNGSSPRVRGTAHRRQPRQHRLRFIPACAGNSWYCGKRRRRGTVHPRVCGEQTLSAPSIAVSVGSSPRVRGTEGLGGCSQICLRFIPACAGNRPRAQPPAAARPVHPRVCGEQSRQPREPYTRYGSSPRVRGTARSSLARTGACRFIPACAGNSCQSPSCIPPPPVHPRVCGEQGTTLSVFSC